MLSEWDCCKGGARITEGSNKQSRCKPMAWVRMITEMVVRCKYTEDLLDKYFTSDVADGLNLGAKEKGLIFYLLALVKK